MVIYRIVNQMNQKCYIGQTIMEPKKRWNAHKYKRGSSAIHSAIKKYGIENFTFDIIDHTSSLNTKSQIRFFKNSCGEIIEVSILSDFCKGCNLTDYNMRRVFNGKRKSHKNWTRPSDLEIKLFLENNRSHNV